MRHLKNIGRFARHAAAALALACCAASAAAAQDANTNYRPAPHDPFVKPKTAPRKKAEEPKKKKSVPTVVAPPSVKARIEAYKEQRARAMEAQLPVPKPTTALVLGETQITGIFRTPRGYAAMVLATPIKLSYVIYPGERFYDAQLVAIEEGRLVFRRERQWSDGRREMTVETKPLRKVAAGDQLAAAAEKLKDDRPAAGTAAPPASPSRDDATAAPRDATTFEIGPRGMNVAEPGDDPTRGVGRAVPPPGADGAFNPWELLDDPEFKRLSREGAKCPRGEARINWEAKTVTCKFSS